MVKIKTNYFKNNLLLSYLIVFIDIVWVEKE